MTAPIHSRDELSDLHKARLTLISTATEYTPDTDPLTALRFAADELLMPHLILDERFTYLALTLLGDLLALSELRPRCDHDRHRYTDELGPANCDDIIHDDITQLDCCDDPFTLLDELVCHTFESPMTFFDDRITNDLMTVLKGG